MTAQPYQPATDRPATDEQEAGGRATDEDEAGSLHAASPDPDLVVVPEDAVANPDELPDSEDVVARTVVEVDAADDDGAGDYRAANPATASTAAASPMTAGMQPAGLGQQWHDIQATFVDDPQGSVQRAAAAAGAAVSALADILRQRQAALTPAGGDSADTEQLREALRSYRIFCQNLADVGQQLRQPRP